MTGLTRRIPLTQGQSVLVDDEEWLVLQLDPRFRGTWQAQRVGRNFYAVKSVREGRGQDSPVTKFQLARLIAGSPANRNVRFKNGNTLDCRRCNLLVDGMPLEPRTPPKSEGA